jgi:pimeloyl-ACP methyl ester carboxylesterase
LANGITVRGRDRHNPILLVLHGGPAAPDLPNRYLFEGPWTDYFTVVEWDQRGSGKTYESNEPAKVAPQAPSKRWVWFEHSGHMMYAEEPGRVLVNLVQLALPFATASARANE